jgi:ectoine hydroxylase-related dioxygenase (phytanoyl-CoA dioxygenase family)
MGFTAAHPGSRLRQPRLESPVAQRRPGGGQKGRPQEEAVSVTAYGIDNALAELGVTADTLTDAERRALDDDGYVILPGVIDAEWLDAMRDRYEYLMEKEGASAGKEVHQEKGTRRLSDLANKGEVFDSVYTNPRLLACVRHVLQRDFKLSALNARDAEPGQGHQALHGDWGYEGRDEATGGARFHVVNSVWLLDDFTSENGATRLVPGTHKLAGSVSDHVEDPLAAHPDEKLLIAPAGSVAVFNAHVWHGGTQNRTQTTRRAFFPYFTAREHPQSTDQREYLRKATYDRLSPAARYILDV